MLWSSSKILTAPWNILIIDYPFFLLRPGRWEHVPEAAAAIPGVWGNMMTFLGGPRACIAYRFALVEWVLKFLGAS
jgi:hypothetical protein